jgi:hypothetical protein
MTGMIVNDDPARGECVRRRPQKERQEDKDEKFSHGRANAELTGRTAKINAFRPQQPLPKEGTGALLEGREQSVL